MLFTTSLTSVQTSQLLLFREKIKTNILCLSDIVIDLYTESKCFLFSSYKDLKEKVLIKRNATKKAHISECLTGDSFFYLTDKQIPKDTWLSQLHDTKRVLLDFLVLVWK